jgi:hypothetical protein
VRNYDDLDLDEPETDVSRSNGHKPTGSRKQNLAKLDGQLRALRGEPEQIEPEEVDEPMEVSKIRRKNKIKARVVGTHRLALVADEVPEEPLPATKENLENACGVREVAEVAQVADLGADTPTTPENDQGKLLRGIEKILRKYLVFPNSYDYVTVSLWIAHCHALDSFDATGRLAFMSPEPQSGKSRCLEVIELLINNPIITMNATVSAIFRSISKDKTVMLFDEVDNIFTGTRDSEKELTGLINSGYRRGGYVLRTVKKGKDGDLEAGKFPSFCPIALAGLGYLPETIASRSIIIHMRPRTSEEPILKYSRREIEKTTTDLKNRLTTLYETLTDQLSSSRPILPPDVDDRAEEVWEPLMAIAKEAGGDWYQRAYQACEESVKIRSVDIITPGIQLLKDIKLIFETEGVNKISSETLIDYLKNLEESMWGEQHKNFTQRKLAQMLRGYQIPSSNIKFSSGVVKKGYRTSQFVDTWKRYLGQ